VAVAASGVYRDKKIRHYRKVATAEELRAELAKRIALLRDKGYVDLEALPPPSDAKTDGRES
jgi:hypothetical protein